MPGIWYRTGTIAVVNGSDAVTGTGTQWSDPKVGAQPGNMIFMPDGKPYEVAYVLSHTHLRLASVYGGPSASGQAYAIVTPLVGSVPALANRVASTLAFAQGQYETLDAWAHGGETEDVTITNPNNGVTTVVPSLAKLSKMTETVGDASPAAERAVAAAAEAQGYKDAALTAAQSAGQDATATAQLAFQVSQDAQVVQAAVAQVSQDAQVVQATAVQVAADKDAAAGSATLASQKAGEAVATEQRIGDAAAAQISAITSEGGVQVARVTDEGDSQVARVASEGAAKASAITAEGDSQVARVIDEGVTQVASVASEGAAQTNRVTAEGGTQVARVVNEGAAQVQAATAQAQAAEAAAQRAEDLVDQATGGALLKEQNLGDVLDKASARTNLDVPSKSEVSAQIVQAIEDVTPDSIGARPASWTPTAEEVGARPATWLPRLDEINAASKDSVAVLRPPHSVTYEYVNGQISTMTEQLPDGTRVTTFTYSGDLLTKTVEVFGAVTRTTTYTYSPEQELTGVITTEDIV